MKEKRIDSKFRDEEFKLNQRKRDLQMLEDQLHMKNKDLQHKEFDLLNADDPKDISSSKMADLADRYNLVITIEILYVLTISVVWNRTFELEKREESLKRKTEELESWERKLYEDDFDYQRRYV